MHVHLVTGKDVVEDDDVCVEFDVPNNFKAFLEAIERAKKIGDCMCFFDRDGLPVDVVKLLAGSRRVHPSARTLGVTPEKNF